MITCRECFTRGSHGHDGCGNTSFQRWRDLTAKRGSFYQYKIVPMVGIAGKLKPRAKSALTSNPIHLSGECRDISAYFNRGILATQFLTRRIPKGPSGRPSYIKLDERIDQPGDPLRDRLSGDLRPAMMSLLDRARKQGGACYGPLYELSDLELEQTLVGASFVHLVLSNTGTDDATNVSGRQALHDSHTDVADRMLSNGRIGHNKFMVYIDSTGKPKAVLTGSTNWTPTVICGQTNNALVIESEKLATFYFNYWKRLKKDIDDAGEDASALQAQKFRQDNNQS